METTPPPYILQRPRLDIMSGTLQFINNLAGNPDTEEQTAQKALIRSHVMKHFRRQQRKDELRQRATRVVAPCGDIPRVSSIRTDHGQVDGKLGHCADCSPNERCNLHHLRPQGDVPCYETSLSKEKDSTTSYVTPEPSECSAETPGSVISSQDHRFANHHAHSQGAITMPSKIHSPSVWRVRSSWIWSKASFPCSTCPPQ